MTARISLNLGRTGGHRPPLQSEHFLPLGKANFGRGCREAAGRVNRIHSYRPSPGLRPPSPRGRGTRTRQRGKSQSRNVLLQERRRSETAAAVCGRELQDGFRLVGGKAAALGQIWSTAATAAEAIQGLFEDRGNIHSAVRGSSENHSHLPFTFISEKNDRRRACCDFRG